MQDILNIFFLITQLFPDAPYSTNSFILLDCERAAFHLVFCIYFSYVVLPLELGFPLFFQVRTFSFTLKIVRKFIFSIWIISMFN